MKMIRTERELNRDEQETTMRMPTVKQRVENIIAHMATVHVEIASMMIGSEGWIALCHCDWSKSIFPVIRNISCDTHLFSHLFDLVAPINNIYATALIGN